MIPRFLPAALAAGSVVVLLIAAPRAWTLEPEPPADGPLTLHEAVEASLRHFPTVRSARADAEGAEAGLAGERAGWIPDLSLRGSATRYEEPSVVYPIHGFGPGEIPPFNRSVFQGGLFLNYTLFDGWGRMSRVRQARAQVEASQASRDGSESALIAQVAATYLQTMSRREALAAHDSRLAALRAERERVRTFDRAGKAARVEVLRVEAALAGAEAERVHLTAALAGSERDLTGLTGIPQTRTRADNLIPVSVADTLLAPADTLVARAFAANPEVRQAERAAAAARAATGAAKSARLPQVAFTGGYQAWSDPDGNSSTEWNLGVMLNQTLFAGGEVTARVHQAEARGRHADEGLRLARISTRRAVLDARDAVGEADARVRSLASAVARYDEVARIEALALSTGTGTQTDFLTAEADLLAARADLADARRAAAVSRVELARLTGALDAGWLSLHLESSR